MTTPLSGMVGPEASAAEQSRMELQARLNGLGGLNGRQLDPEAKAKKLREACEGFESIFIQKMWQEMRNAVPKTGILSGREERFWQDMYDQELSKSMTKAGGIGLANMMYEQLSRNLVSASRSAAGTAQGAVFAPSAAPLVREVAEEAPGLDAKLAASIYDGEAAETGAVTEIAQKPDNKSTSNQPVQPAQPIQTAAVEQPAAQAQVGAVEAKPEKKHLRKADLGQSSGLLQAQKARRDAGDKLGSRAVRPSQRTRKIDSSQAGEMQADENPSQIVRHGTAESLKAAIELARTGAPAATNSQALNLNNIVANAQAMNASQQVEAPSEGLQANAAEPVTRKVRFSTNVPKQANLNSKKNTKQAIRMLNVDNVGVNSKQGQGLAAYHAQQEAAKTAQPQAANQNAAAPIAPLTADQATSMQAAATPIPPLTSKSDLADTDNGTNFAIPPLTAADSRS